MADLAMYPHVHTDTCTLLASLVVSLHPNFDGRLDRAVLWLYQRVCMTGKNFALRVCCTDDS